MKLSTLLVLLLFSTVTHADTIQAGPSYPVCDLTTLACAFPGGPTLFYMDPTIPDGATLKYLPLSEVLADPVGAEVLAYAEYISDEANVDIPTPIVTGMGTIDPAPIVYPDPLKSDPINTPEPVTALMLIAGLGLLTIKGLRSSGAAGRI